VSKNKLTQQELQYIKERERGLTETINTLKDVSRFKEGDFLIAFHYASNWGDTRRRQVLNSYGAPKKFTVVHVDCNGIPYMKELNKKGLPTGNLICSVKVDDGYRKIKHAEYRFEVDPDYADSIIMADEDNYDASQIHRMKGDLFKDITKHNKSLKIKVNDPQTLMSFLQYLKVGDVLWRSSKTNITIIQLDPIPTTHNGKRLDENKTFGKARDSKGKEINLSGWYFRCSAIYTGQPRSYNELKDPK
jgi:hypothetical protein